MAKRPPEVTKEDLHRALGALFDQLMEHSSVLEANLSEEDKAAFNEWPSNRGGSDVVDALRAIREATGTLARIIRRLAIDIWGME